MIPLFRHESVRFCSEDSLPGELDVIEASASEASIPFERRAIGHSRSGLALWGLRIGRGEKSVSIIAGAHADEPVGPMTAIALARWLVQSREGRGLLESHTFYICPQVNPDGAQANRAWFSDPLDPIAYLREAIREAPGEDVEFGYPQPESLATPYFATEKRRTGPLRPENEAVARFLAPGAPFAFHASLHGLGISEGAWFLIGAPWAERSGPLRARLTNTARALGFGQHDIDRGGEKGFTRIARGFSTTPNARAMRDFFLARDDTETAAKFHLSSMDFVEALGGDPLCMVSEVPLFTIGMAHEWTDPPGEETPSKLLRARLPEARLALAGGDGAPLESLLVEFQITPTPLAAQMELQGRMILEALDFLASRTSETKAMGAERV